MRSFAFAIAALAAGCDCYSAHEGSDRCTPGARCVGDVHERCGDDGALARRDCAAEALVCDDTLGCIACVPGERRCADTTVERCRDDGSGWVVESECDPGRGDLCERGECLPACEATARAGSTAGCDFWAVDLPLAASPGFDDPFSIVVANELSAIASVEIRAVDGAGGGEVVVDRADVAAGDLHAFALDRRPVEGADGSARSSAAYRVVSTLPVRATQIGGSGGVGPPSPDGSLLLPAAALGARTVVISWPQTIGVPDFAVGFPSFVTIVGTEGDTTVTVTPADDVRPIEGIDGRANEPFEVPLGPYEVLHLETSASHADLTGTLIESTAPVAVFAGSAASDVPAWETLDERQCCAGHLEEQVPPVDRLGTDTLVPLAPSRSAAVHEAGGTVTVVAETTYVRVVAAGAGRTSIETTLAAPWDSFDLPERGIATIEATADFRIESSQPVLVATFGGSQQGTGIASSLPAGAPTFAIVPPVDRYVRATTFLVPSGLPFDFVTVLGAEEVPVWDVSGTPLVCESVVVAAGFVVRRCQVSFPVIREDQPDPETGDPPWVDSVLQADGAQGIRSDTPFAVLVTGFGSNAAWAMPGL